MYCHVLPYIAMYYHVLLCFAMYCHAYPFITMYFRVLPCNSMYSHVLPYIAMYCHVSPWITMYCYLLPCVAMYYHVCLKSECEKSFTQFRGSPRKGSFSEWKDIFPRRATFFHQGTFPVRFKVIPVGVTRWYFLEECDVLSGLKTDTTWQWYSSAIRLFRVYPLLKDSYELVAPEEQGFRP